MSLHRSFSIVGWEYVPCCNFQADFENKETSFLEMLACFTIGRTGAAWFPTDSHPKGDSLGSSKGWTPAVKSLVGSLCFTLLPVFIIPAGI